MDLKIAGKRVLVTGASKGLGRATVESLVGEGCEVMMVSRDIAALEQARADILSRHPGGAMSIFPADLGTAQGVAATLGQFPAIDALVNNAGAIRRGTLSETSDELLQSSWDLKLHGYLRMTRGYYEVMKARRSGVIVNVIGVTGERPIPTYIAGSMANAALMAFTRTLGSASHADGIRVVGLNPGPTQTEKLVRGLMDRARREFGDPERWRDYTQRMPFGGPGNPQGVGDMIAFLISERASYVSGTIITIDGGLCSSPIST